MIEVCATAKEVGILAHRNHNKKSILIKLTHTFINITLKSQKKNTQNMNNTSLSNIL